jgi:P-type Cu2+ transporter
MSRSLADGTGRIASSRCPHCGTAVEGAEDVFCCHGCELAASIIAGAGLEEEYHARREEFAPRPGPLSEAWTAVQPETLPDGSCEARLVVDGLRCASCVWVVERVLERTPGVVHATVSYATGRTTLQWDPQHVDLPVLAGRIAALGYTPRSLGEESKPDRSILIKLSVASFATVWLMLLYEGIYAGWFFGIDDDVAQLFRWVSLIISTPVAMWCASPFFEGAWAGLKNRMLHMDAPIALGIVVLYVHGFIATLFHVDGYLDSLGMLIALLLVGRQLEARGRRRAAEAAMALAATAPQSARRTRGDGTVETVAVDELRVGDEIDVGAGEELPADGIVTEGFGHLRMALLTGEAEPVAVSPGDRVVAGTVLLDGALSVRLTEVGEETLLQTMAAELRNAADRAMRPGTGDRVAPWFTFFTLGTAAATYAGWWYFAGWTAAIAPTVAVLVVACPCALALARPLSAAAGLGAAARRGLLLRSGDALLDLGRVDLVALDKTGTVTAGALTVVEADDEVLRIAAGLERFSGHPIARAIVDEAARRRIPLPRGERVRETAGIGVRGRVDGRQWEIRSGGPGEVHLVDDRGRARPIRLADAVRPDAADTVAGLRRLGLEVTLLTGDHEATARRIGWGAGITDVIARAEPSDKAAWVEARRRQGKRVLFAGDGLNDGPALAAADVGVAMSTGAASSVLVADGVISSPATTPLLAGLRAARAATRATNRAQDWSVAYNIGAMALAAAGYVNPLVAAVLMPLSTGVVLWYSARVENAVLEEEKRCSQS